LLAAEPETCGDQLRVILKDKTITEAQLPGKNPFFFAAEVIIIALCYNRLQFIKIIYKSETTLLTTGSVCS